MKRSSEILKNMQTRKAQLNSDIEYLKMFEDHFKKMDGKMINKNVLEIKTENLRAWVRAEYSSIRLNAFKLNSEGYTDYKARRLEDCYISISLKECSYVPEGKTKEVLNAAAINEKIDNVIEAKTEEVKTINRITENDIRQTLVKYNAAIDELKEVYQANNYILNNAGMDYSLRNPDRAIIDYEGYRPITREDAEKRVDPDAKLLYKDRDNYKIYLKLRQNALGILKKSDCYVEKKTLDLVGLYDCIVTGDSDYCSIVPLCVDKYGVIPSLNVSIVRGCLC